MAEYKVKVLQKLFSILDLFFAENVELTTGEIAKSLDMNRTSVFRIISNLEEQGYLELDPITSRYRLGLKLLVLSSFSNPFLHLKSTARPYLEDLNQKSGETVHMAMLRGGKTFYLDKVEGQQTIRVVISQVGHDLPAHCCGVGKLLLAFLPEDEAKRIVTERGMHRYTENTLCTWEQLESELRKIREQGIARDLEEVEIGLSCLAAPIFSDDTVVAAVSVSMPITRLNLENDRIMALVRQAAKDISGQLMGVFPKNMRMRRDRGI